MNTGRLDSAQAIRLVAGREIYTRVWSRAFIIGTAVMVAVIGGYVLHARLRQAGVDPASLQRAVAETRAEVESLSPGDPHRAQRLAIALIASTLLYFSLVVYRMAVAQGVVEKKSSRVVELLLATVRPYQLLAGKIVGIGLTGLLQLAILGGSVPSRRSVPVSWMSRRSAGP